MTITQPDATRAGQDLPRLKLWLADRIEASLANKVKLERSPNVVQLVRDRFKLACQHARLTLPPDEEESFFNEVLDEIVGYGPIESLLNDETITEVMVNGPYLIYVERSGKLTEMPVKFVDNDHVQKIINKIVEPLGRHVDAQSPMVDARLPDGSRVNAVVPPCAIDGPTVTIRKFSKDRFTIQDLVRFGSLTQDMADYLEACVVSKLNVIVSGGTGSGKTTLLNVLSGFIPDHERIVTIEDAAELKLNQRHVVRLETKQPSHEGDSHVTIRQLVINSLRMRPERIVVGECRGGEALDMLQAMNTGHDGSLTTIHANTPRDTLSRLETLVLMAGMDLPVQVVRKQIASAVNLIVQQARLRDGSRKITHITEVAGMEGETIVMQDIFKFEDMGEQNGKVAGEYAPGGLRPYYSDRLKTHGFNLPPKMFMKTSGPAEGGPRRR
ncbi:MAG: CpaF family protein [Chloroflexi bacterium]|nr:CpaF family protein [Chloroflexota bacterium]MCI0577750.1 CpaF family protein [Chloroflexota bacterium]MCI0644656.1 CpaF family protein [Chloroflexota bacterium]MCI0728040.1 CpaF family protein [Chloroflexota bacterium]